MTLNTDILIFVMKKCISIFKSSLKCFISLPAYLCLPISVIMLYIILCFVHVNLHVHLERNILQNKLYYNNLNLKTSNKYLILYLEALILIKYYRNTLCNI